MSTLWGAFVGSSSSSISKLGCSGNGNGSKGPNSSSTAAAAGAPAPVHVPPAGVFLNPPSNPRGALLRAMGSPMDKATATATATSSFAPAGAPGPLASAPTAVGGLTPELPRGHMDDILVGLRLGDFGGRVGMLPGLRPKFMDKYAVRASGRVWICSLIEAPDARHRSAMWVTPKGHGGRGTGRMKIAGV